MIIKYTLNCIFIILIVIVTNNVFASTDDEDKSLEPAVVQTLPNAWNNYENLDYGVNLQYPNNWIKFDGDIAPGDFVTNIVTFKAPFDSTDEEIEKGENSEKQLRGHQNIRFAIYHPPVPLINTQHDLDLYLQEQLVSYGTDKNEQILDYTSRNVTLGGEDHPAFKVHLTFETGKYEMEQLRLGTIIDGNVYYIDYTVFPENYESNFSTFQQMLDSLDFR